MEFDNNGNLFPYGIITLSAAELSLTFGYNSIRRSLLNNFFLQVEELKIILNDEFTVWINGSFVTQKTDSKDIDIVVFLSYKHLSSKEILLSSFKERQEYVDLYYAKVFPEDHENFELTRFDYLHWFYFFTTNRKNKRKGFIQIKF
ncbi:DUF6932 family protein [Dyadobacter sp. NIV53]|uniref:DUF6932 family protein n=1 Tax=Dyadobacter sp. NIV53 TaxID=2861765 RepID=UPI001C85E09D|nr:hypothetical protein [Dyadobacter sp. NIV53]